MPGCSRVAAALEPQGMFVLGDLVVPERPEDVVTQVDGVFDRPDSVRDQLAWLDRAGLVASVSWSAQDLAVLSARRI